MNHLINSTGHVMRRGDSEAARVAIEIHIRDHAKKYKHDSLYTCLLSSSQNSFHIYSGSEPKKFCNSVLQNCHVNYFEFSRLAIAKNQRPHKSVLFLNNIIIV